MTYRIVESVLHQYNVREHIAAIREAINSLERLRMSFSKDHGAVSHDNQYLAELFVEVYTDNIKNLHRLEQKLLHTIKTKPTSPDNVTDAMIAAAKDYPIAELLPIPIGRADRKVLKTKCPFHNDKNPSFAIYTDNNFWVCFSGCGQGDSIDFFMKLHNLTFIEAVKKLAQL